MTVKLPVSDQWHSLQVHDQLAEANTYRILVSTTSWAMSQYMVPDLDRGMSGAY